MTLLEKRIQELGIKKTWLAEKCNITTRQLSRWLKYENISQVENFMQLMKILKLNKEEIMEDIKRIGK